MQEQRNKITANPHWQVMPKSVGRFQILGITININININNINVINININIKMEQLLCLALVLIIIYLWWWCKNHEVYTVYSPTRKANIPIKRTLKPAI